MKNNHKFNDSRMGESLFNTLYEQLCESVFRFVFFMVKERDEAEDITQEIFCRLYNHLKFGATIKNPRAWTYRVGVNLCLNVIKKNKKNRQLLEDSAEQISEFVMPGKDEDVEQRAIKNQERMIVKNAINNLPVRDQLILGLYQEGFSYSQMASMVGVRKVSMRTILYRAITKLEKDIKKGAKNEMFNG